MTNSPDQIAPPPKGQTEPVLWLKRGEERRLRAGHLWVFSNEIDVGRSPLTAFEPGDEAEIRDHKGKTIGRGYVNPHSLICARLVSRDARQSLSRSLLVHRLKVALSLRQRLFERPYYRLIYGESDALPGLVVDRFGDTCVAQINTAGMERRKADIVEALTKTVKARHILLRGDSPFRTLEGLESYVEWAGDPGPELLTVEENGARYKVSATGGQKTGWYYDHRMNRARLCRYAPGRRVLDVFSYVGAWSIPAALAGASQVTAVDSSAAALDRLAQNGADNKVGDRIETLRGDAAQILPRLREARERFDIIVVDPPAFIKRKKDYKQGLAAYRQLNQAALQLLTRDGLLVTSSCSSHLAEPDFVRELLAAARHLDRSLQIVEFGQQGPDHPVHPAIPETRYIKTVFARVLPASSNP